MIPTLRALRLSAIASLMPDARGVRLRVLVEQWLREVAR